MAKTKEINSRIINKHDIEANWNNAATFIPQKGEIIIYDIDDNFTYERFKIGDGITTVINLPFVDETLPIPTKTSQLENDSNFITKEYVDNSIAQFIIATDDDIINLMSELGYLSSLVIDNENNIYTNSLGDIYTL